MSQYRTQYGNEPQRRTFARCGRPNVQEMMKQELLKQSGEESSYKITMPQQQSAPPSIFAPAVNEIGFEDNYLYFDGRARDSSSDIANGELKFSIASLNNSLPLENVVAMKLDGFFFPNVINPTTSPTYHFYRRMYMTLTNFTQTQAVSSANGFFYHYELDLDNTTSIAVKCNPVDSHFYFTRPVNSIDVITFRFTVPHSFRRAVIPKDTIVVTALAGTNPGQFRIENADQTTLLTSLTPPTGALATNDQIAVFFSGFGSSNATINVAVSNINGLMIDNVISSTTFSISTLDFTALPVDTLCTAYIAKNRVAFGMRFTTAREYKTNYLKVTHD